MYWNFSMLYCFYIYLRLSHNEYMTSVHGLFVNSDHWRKTIKDLEMQGNVRVYAIDLLGNGYSSKPPRDSVESKALNGENGKFDDANYPSIIKNVQLGTAFGGQRIADVDLKHPLGSCYNFYTWADLCKDFTEEIIISEDRKQKCSFVCNSIGTITSLQAASDAPHLFNGVFIINPNFRELHSAEVPLSSLSMPIVRAIQSALRERGQGLFDLLAKPDTVKQILMEPYAVSEAVDDELVTVLLDPLLTKGASDVVFDSLSYSAGPLPEQLLADNSLLPDTTPVWVCYGEKDPWTPSSRVQSLINLKKVEKVIPLAGAGHCPHDEVPELVSPLLQQFLERVASLSAVDKSVLSTDKIANTV